MLNFHTISGRNRRRKIVVITTTAFVIGYIVWPLIWMLICSFQYEEILREIPPTIILRPEIFTLDHYEFIFTGDIPVGTTIMLQALYTMDGVLILPALKNSFIVAISVAILNLIIGVPAAHAFARIRYRFSNGLFLSIFSTRMLPAISLVIPLFILFSELGLIDTIQGLVIIGTATTLPFTLWLMRNFLTSLPLEIEEAALIDGAGRWRTLFKIILPMAKPGLIATALFAFMITYGDFIFALNLTHSMQAKTMPVVIASLATGMSASKGLVAAAAVVCIIPTLIIALIFRKRLIDALTQQFR